jgi:PASTA domain
MSARGRHATILPRARVRGVGALTMLALFIGACAGGVPSGSSGPAGSLRPTKAALEDPAAVPDVIGLNEADAVKALAESGLVANVRLDRDAPRTGAVRRSTPASGNEPSEHMVVVLDVALRPRLPVPEPEHEQDAHMLSSLVDGSPAAFVGLYRDGRGTAVIVFGPGVDPGSWRDRLTAAAAGLPYRTEMCSRDRRSLRAMQDEIATQDWSASKSPPFGVWVDPSSCTVRVESDLLTPGHIEALADRFGTAISTDTTPGSHPELLPLAK